MILLRWILETHYATKFLAMSLCLQRRKLLARIKTFSNAILSFNGTRICDICIMFYAQEKIFEFSFHLLLTLIFCGVDFGIIPGWDYEFDISFKNYKVICPEYLKCLTFSMKKKAFLHFLFVHVFVNYCCSAQTRTRISDNLSLRNRHNYKIAKFVHLSGKFDCLQKFVAVALWNSILYPLRKRWGKFVLGLYKLK
jgi:hypothetical protein